MSPTICGSSSSMGDGHGSSPHTGEGGVLWLPDDHAVRDFLRPLGADGGLAQGGGHGY
ncbi:hypothetical protein [Streptomyces sp. NPDC058855]|uniref:hypothetical protein n=1 Tax=Streptomyces sp. NPDC058855 TaxID=3346651 RepID=UPI0036B79E83